VISFPDQPKTKLLQSAYDFPEGGICWKFSH
jgi:hypothetical protein